MTALPALDEELLHRLPLPLAQLYLRAHNAKTPLDRHLAAYYLWEASLKLLACVAIVEYARLGSHDPNLVECLTSLARPSLGHWWEYVRRLLPALADGDPRLQKARDLLLGRAHDDLPRAAGLDAALREALSGPGGARATVSLTELFDRLVRYRGREIGHGAAGQRPRDFYERMGQALLLGTAQVLGRLDVLAGRRLIYVGEVRQSAGAWLVERYELIGESARRIESLELPLSGSARLPIAERVYLQGAGAEAELHPLHPLLLYEPEAEEVLFLNSRRGQQRAEYLCYTTGRVTERPDLGGEQRQLLAQVLGLPVEEQQAERWAARAEENEPPSEDATPEPGHRIGEFELLSELGRGGMGAVYRAWQPSLGRQVALKCLLRGDAKAEARFSREIRALGRVEHPHLVKVFTSGAEGAQWFYAMELVEGATLAAVSDKLRASTPCAADVEPRTWQDMLDTACAEAREAERPLSDRASSAQPAGSAVPTGAAAAPRPPGHVPTAEPTAALPAPSPRPPTAAPGRSYARHVVELVRQVAEAAHALHEAGIIHRDIKPGNIMVTADGGRAVMMDLGLAQLADAVDGRLTRTRQFVGTLRYASPQQVLAVARLNRRTDVYSLGATLWELLTLRPLYGADDDTPPPELMESIQRQEPELPRKYNPELPRDLEAIVLKCLEKEPARRYATAGDLAADLGRFLDGETVQARPVGGIERVWRWVRRRPAIAALLLVSSLALLGLVGGGWRRTTMPGCNTLMAAWRRRRNRWRRRWLRPTKRERKRRRRSTARRRSGSGRRWRRRARRTSSTS